MMRCCIGVCEPDAIIRINDKRRKESKDAAPRFEADWQRDSWWPCTSQGYLIPATFLSSSPAHIPPSLASSYSAAFAYLTPLCNHDQSARYPPSPASCVARAIRMHDRSCEKESRSCAGIGRCGMVLPAREARVSSACGKREEGTDRDRSRRPSLRSPQTMPRSKGSMMASRHQIPRCSYRRCRSRG
jgi:hypothetical protein